MDPKQFVIEFKPWLHSCEFFLQSKCAVKTLNIYVNDDRVKVQVNGGEKLVINMAGWNIISGSTCGINVTQNNGLNFKVRTKYLEEYHCNLAALFPFIPNYKPPPNVHKLPFQENEMVTFYCRGCSNKVVTLKFSQIVRDKSSLDIVQDACCAAPSHILFHSSLIPATKKNMVIRCDFCRRWLGCKDKSLACIWYTGCSINVIEAVEEESSKDFLALNDFMSTAKCLIHKSSSDSTKIILSCQLDEDLKCYILIRGIEKSMILLKPDEPSQEEVYLNDEQVLKVAYSLEESDSINLKKWRGYRAEESLISIHMWKSGLKYLQEMSSIVPNDFKMASQCLVSYVEN